MKKSIFFGHRRKKFMERKHISTLVLHLYDSERWPLDVKAHLDSLKGEGLLLAIEVIESHRKGDPGFREYAEMLISLQR